VNSTKQYNSVELTHQKEMMDQLDLHHLSYFFYTGATFLRKTFNGL